VTRKSFLFGNTSNSDRQKVQGEVVMLVQFYLSYDMNGRNGIEKGYLVYVAIRKQ